MNPVISISLLIPLALMLLAATAWMGWRSSDAVSSGLRKLLMGLRIAAVLMLLIFLFNPGEWRAVEDQLSKVWAVMLDRSSSMSVEEADPAEEGKTSTRIAQAMRLRDRMEDLAGDAGVDVRFYSYDDALKEVEPDSAPTPDGKASDLTSSADELLTQLSSQGESLSGVLVLGDGRQTSSPRHSNFELRAQALNVPFFAVPIGGEQASKDLSLHLPRKTVTAFPGQQVQLTAVLLADGLGQVDTELTLSDAEGKPVESVKVKLKPGERHVHHFSIVAPEQSSLFRLMVPARDGEMRLSNNQAELRLRILDEKAKVFIAEGAPYWDSKFLAQLLRQQKHMEVVSVHRLSESRWFRVDSGESKPHESEVDVFPDTREELSRYDLIIFGKNSEHFLTPERIALLRGFVKDQGGAVLFSRSKPYTGVMPDLAPLEPVSWKTGVSGNFSMRPSADGQTAGLFGQALPAPESPVWKSLPELKDAHRIDVVKPFTRVLAYGELGSATGQGRFPLLMVRRYGQGVTGLVNADGLWKWDFFPEARELGNMYQEFWIQMIHWMLSYSEFLPGQDYSLNVSASSIEPGTPVALRMSYRGGGQPDAPQVEVTSPALDEPLRLAPAEVPSDDGRVKWGASFTPTEAGNYQLRLIASADVPRDEAKPQGSMPEAVVTVVAPPGEMDELSADAGYLKRFCEGTGGKILTAEQLEAFLKEQMKPVAPEQRDHGVEWHSHWMHWLSPILLLVFLSLEWWLRRRNGLA
ncbi:hypothetical protein HW115_08120 [Verrucomicrobiaceae bacterium N1E253]|uniref:Glutamine amidotransferase domain-containing protein n=1 Tax=Oceaniferula marina TaxID=2748318 RepID=A0A851GN74_9BACT|nr:hypothetical protein [Oceaniferula marina]NWK55574.1 hypothetical protein [Oceaniferula marina]